jgi:hypothetical protein
MSDGGATRGGGVGHRSVNRSGSIVYAVGGPAPSAVIVVSQQLLTLIADCADAVCTIAVVLLHKVRALTDIIRGEGTVIDPWW